MRTCGHNICGDAPAGTEGKHAGCTVMLASQRCVAHARAHGPRLAACSQICVRTSFPSQPCTAGIRLPGDLLPQGRLRSAAELS